jgi:hypothetical protein
LNEVTRDSLLKQARDLAESQGNDFVLRTDFKRATGISDHQILNHFDGWTEFFTEAGLQPQSNQPATEDALLQDALAAFADCESVPTFTKFSKLVAFSPKTYRRRWGTWPDFLSAFVEWANETDPDFHLLPLIRDAIATPEITPVVNAGSNGAAPTKWSQGSGRTFGPFLNFRGLQHEPINEQGVVLLFGMVAFELGYVVESVATAFPDCEAKRRIKTKPETWQRLSIEFEYVSKNFLEHGHDPEKCDLIVCWRHNWADCPLEVIELATAIQTLDDG